MGGTLRRSTQGGCTTLILSYLMQEAQQGLGKAWVTQWGSCHRGLHENWNPHCVPKAPHTAAVPPPGPTHRTPAPEPFSRVRHAVQLHKLKRWLNQRAGSAARARQGLGDPVGFMSSSQPHKSPLGPQGPTHNCCAALTPQINTGHIYCTPLPDLVS
jgi:hypothetical protein